MDKPDKPYPTFPLYAHGSGQWAKKILGKTHYFGAWDDPEGALDHYQAVKDDLHAGRSPRPRGTVDLLTLCNEFAYSKRLDWERGELKKVSYLGCKSICEKTLASLGRTLDVESMQASDFAKLRSDLGKDTDSPVTLKNRVTGARMLFKWAFDSGLIPNQLPYLKALKKPSEALLRKAKAEGPVKLFTATEIDEIIRQADGFMKPCLYLAINGGYGNRDVCELKWEHIKGEWVAMPRSKNYMSRRVWLWPETRKALAEWKAIAPISDHVVCQPNGKPHGTKGHSTPISRLFQELMTKKVRAGRGFYAIRHTFRTVADDTNDQVAIAVMMGHADKSISATYREKIKPERIKAVASYVRDWLLAKR